MPAERSLDKRCAKPLRVSKAGALGGWLIFAWLFLVILWCAFGVVCHAEALAHRLGEPYGTLVLTLAVAEFPGDIATPARLREPAPAP